jgi:hypothetical protein
MRPRWFAEALGLVLVCSAVGCGEGVDDDFEQAQDELLRKTDSTSAWSYFGLLPELESPQLIVSLAGHTVRVTGRLPLGFNGPLPFYALWEPDPTTAGRMVVHVVYPIATVNAGGVTSDGLPARNPEPDEYSVCGGNVAHASNDVGSFGGFPFIEYVCRHRDQDGRVRSGIAFHGPITSELREDTEYWSLRRGPVSHACNRMLGEHVLELARLIGFGVGARSTPVRVIADFDRYRGKKVDVDYAATGWLRPPASESFIFPTWQAVSARPDGTAALEFPRWACETSRCGSMPPNARDWETGGLSVGEIACPSAYSLEAIGRGAICVSGDGLHAWGPFTQAMTDACRATGGGRGCGSDRWAASFARRIRGDGVCPLGARFDALTGYCAEGNNAFGPFPESLIERCLDAGGRAACRSARWNRGFLARLMGRI